MARKAADHNTPERPPLDDVARKLKRLSAADWAPLNAAFARATAALTSSDLALRDLHDDLRSGRLPSAVQIIARDGTETSGRQNASFWQKVELRRWLDGVAVSFIDRRHVSTSSIRYFVARRDLYRLYPADSAPVDHDDSDSDARAKPPGPKPRGDWPTLIEQWLSEFAGDDPQKPQNIDELVIEAQNFLHNRIKWAPSNTKALRAKIRELLRRVRH